MYVCLCMGVTDREIKDAVRDGACSVPEVMECTGAGTQCGSCRPSIHEVVSRCAPGSGRRSLPMADPALSDERVHSSNAA